MIRLKCHRKCRKKSSFNRQNKQACHKSKRSTARSSPVFNSKKIRKNNQIKNKIPKTTKTLNNNRNNQSNSSNRDRITVFPNSWNWTTSPNNTITPTSTCILSKNCSSIQLNRKWRSTKSSRKSHRSATKSRSFGLKMTSFTRSHTLLMKEASCNHNHSWWRRPSLWASKRSIPSRASKNFQDNPQNPSSIKSILLSIINKATTKNQQTNWAVPVILDWAEASIAMTK